jgi:hypothetical protein
LDYAKYCPNGWTDRNIITASKTIQDQIESLDRPDGTVPLLPRYLSIKTRRASSPYDFLAACALHWEDSIGHPAVVVRYELLQLYTVAIALERHRLNTGSYPETLEELVPAFMSKFPQSNLNLKTPSYEKLPGDSYKIWFFGINGTDDHGTEQTSDFSDLGDIVVTPAEPFP